MTAQTAGDCAGLGALERDTLLSCSPGLGMFNDEIDQMPETLQEPVTIERAPARTETGELTSADVELLHTIAGDSDPEVWKRVGPMNVFLTWDQIEQLQSLRRRIAGILESA